MDDSQKIESETTAEPVVVDRTGPQRFPVAESPLHKAFESGRYPYARLMGRVAYETEKAKLQAELLKVQIWAQETGEVRTAGRPRCAGKGGTIKRFMEL